MVQRDQIEVGRQAFQSGKELLCILFPVVDTIDHGIFEVDPAGGGRIIPAAAFQQRFNGVGFIDRHDPVADLIVGAMEGNCQRNLHFPLCQGIDLGDQTAGRKADVAHGNIHTVFAVHQLQKAHHIIKIVQRLADAHEHHPGHRQAGVDLGMEDLVEHFVGLQPPDQTADGGGAEGTAHGAAHLGGDADGVAVVVAHENGLHAVAVGKLPEVLDGAVLFGFLLADHLGGVDGVLLRQLLPEGLGQVGHFVVAAHTLMEPGIDLLAPEGRLAQLF